MNIIKAGDLKRLQKIRRFECEHCGCIWDSDSSEYHTETDYRNGHYYVMRCPTCSAVAISRPEDRQVTGRG